MEENESLVSTNDYRRSTARTLPVEHSDMDSTSGLVFMGETMDRLSDGLFMSISGLPNDY